MNTIALNPRLNNSVCSLARQGLEKIESTPRWEERRQIGDQFLSTIQLRDQEHLELVITDVCREAGRLSITDQNASIAQVAGLQVLAAGVSGPVGVALAKVGACAVAHSNRWDDACVVGERFTQSIAEQSTNPLDKLVARVSQQVAAVPDLTDENAFRASDAALKLISTGLSGSPETALSRLAESAIDKVNRWDHSRDMGYVFLDQIAQTATSPEKREIANQALKASAEARTDEAGTKLQIKAYQDLQA